MPPKKKSDKSSPSIELAKTFSIKFFAMPSIPKLNLDRFNSEFKGIPFDLFTTARQNFSNPSPANQFLFNKMMPSALWLQVLSCLPIREIAQIMLVSKFLGEISNHESIRKKLGEYKFNKPFRDLQKLIVQEESKTVPLAQPTLYPFLSLKEQINTVEQPGPNGFTMGFE